MTEDGLFAGPQKFAGRGPDWTKGEALSISLTEELQQRVIDEEN